MRAREPDEQGYVDRDGIKIGYETFAFNEHAIRQRDGQPPTVVFAPVDSIVHSRAWKAQVPYLAQHYRVVTIDPRGNGRSDRPTDPAAYDDLAFVDDTIAVMDHLGVGSAVLVGICLSAWHALLVASLHADRVLGVAAVAPWIKDHTPPLSHRLEAAQHFDEELESYDGWYKTNRHFWRDHWPEYATVLLRPDAARAALDQAARGCRRLRPRDERGVHARGGRKAGSTRTRPRRARP